MNWKEYLPHKNQWFIILITLLLLFFIYYTLQPFLWKRKNDKIENFESTSTSTLYPVNLIKNGNFESGTKPTNYIDQSGPNQIIKLPNPTGSGYALEQKKSTTLTYYGLQSYCEDNAKYLFYLWVSFRNENSVENKNIDLSNIIQIRVLKTDSTNYIPVPTYKIIKKVMLKDSNIQWYQVAYTFDTNTDSDNLMNIYLNYSSNLQTDYQYFTGLHLYKVLPEAENFIYNDGLKLYLDGYHFESTSKIWNDVSTYSNNFTWNTNPYVDTTNGYVNSVGNILTGMKSSELLGKSDSPFSFIFIVNKGTQKYTGSGTVEGFTSNTFDEEENFEDMSGGSSLSGITNSIQTILLIPGNNSFSMKLNWNAVKSQLICELPNKKIFKSKSGISFLNKSMISIIYQTGGVFTIYQDGISIINGKGDKLYYSDTDKIIINPNKLLNMNLYAVLDYNRVLSLDELSLIREYFMTNANKDFTKFDYYYKETIPLIFQEIKDINNIAPYNRSDMVNLYNSSEFSVKYGNQGLMYSQDPKTCVSQCNELCNVFIDDNDKYKECMRNCKNVIPACKIYCDDSKNNKSLICEVQSTCNTADPSKNCPLSYKRNGEYMVFIQPKSFYAYKYNYSGEKSYGKDRENARKMYQYNFPKCEIPSILKPGEGKNTLESCPYVVLEGNPCYYSACEGVDWKVKDYHKLDLNDKCKKSVSYYCQINNEWDENCKCWRPENENDSYCREYRKYFENPKDYCKPSQFDISQHPDFNKYIKKDKIPCYGCKVD